MTEPQLPVHPTDVAHIEVAKQRAAVVYVTIIAIICVVAMFAVVVVILWGPKEDRAVILTTIVGFATTICTALMTILRVEKLSVAVDGRLTQLLETSNEASLRRGQDQGKAEAEAVEKEKRL